MHQTIHLVTVLLSLLVFPTGSVLACEKSFLRNDTELSRLLKSEENVGNKSCCDESEEKEEESHEGCDNKICQYPNTINVPFFSTLNGLKVNNLTSQLNEGWAYVRHPFKLVYFAIWQPPEN